MIYKGRYTYTPICDGCGRKLPAEKIYDFAVGAMKADGWAIIRGGGMSAQWYHFCPECNARRKGNG